MQQKLHLIGEKNVKLAAGEIIYPRLKGRKKTVKIKLNYILYSLQIKVLKIFLVQEVKDLNMRLSVKTIFCVWF